MIGYRTKRSSVSKLAWNHANNLCRKYVKYASFINAILGFKFVLLFYFKVLILDDVFQYAIIVQLVLSFVIIIYLIERELKNFKK